MQFGRVRTTLGDPTVDLFAIPVHPGSRRPSRPPIRTGRPPEIAPHGLAVQAQLVGDAADRPALALQLVDPLEPLDAPPSLPLPGLLSWRGHGRTTRRGRARCLGSRPPLDGRR